MTEKEIKKAWWRMRQKLKDKGLGYEGTLNKNGTATICIANIVPYEKLLKTERGEYARKNWADCLGRRGTSAEQRARAEVQLEALMASRPLHEFCEITGASYVSEEERVGVGTLIKLCIRYDVDE